MNIKKLELMIKNDCTYEEIIEESKRIDEYIKEQIKVNAISNAIAEFFRIYLKFKQNKEIGKNAYILAFESVQNKSRVL